MFDRRHTYRATTPDVPLRPSGYTNKDRRSEDVEASLGVIATAVRDLSVVEICGLAP